MGKSNQMQIPFYPDAQQLEVMGKILDAGNFIVASKGSEAFEICEKIEIGGYVRKSFIKKACRIYQFTLTPKGIECLKVEG